MSNRLHFETSPYLLQHAQNPVNWYPWGEEAFEEARLRQKPIFLSIGYSTCHWCHVMAHESFENAEIAEILNRHFVCIKVDREERPDIDHVYMSACQALTGSGGWPTSLFLTYDKKPFFAGTYFPPKERYGMVGFYDLLLEIAELWQTDRESLISSAEKITRQLGAQKMRESTEACNITERAVTRFKRTYDPKNGGFGPAPKFPTPHNLIFLMLYGKLRDDEAAREMALHTLERMRKGGIYDHLGGGFSRYSTDKAFLAPHFEKMLYDNALLIIAYCVGYSLCGKEVLLHTAQECASYVLKEMTDKSGAFYSAQDADSKGGEGLYYVFDYSEILKILGEERGKLFCKHYGVTESGNFKGKNILNRLHDENEIDGFYEERQELYRYRKARMHLHLDDKKLTAWNSLMIAAMAYLYRTSGNYEYLIAAKRAQHFIEEKLCDNDRLFISIKEDKRSTSGLLDDYVYYCAALIALYEADGNETYLKRAGEICRVAVKLFCDDNGGYKMNGKENEELIITAKEAYDGALPSGNSMMYYVLTRLEQLDGKGAWSELREKQEVFMKAESSDYPSGHCMFLLSLLFTEEPPPKIVAVCARGDDVHSVMKALPLYSAPTVLTEEAEGYSLKDGKTTFYVCRGRTCLPPTNEITG